MSLMNLCEGEKLDGRCLSVSLLVCCLFLCPSLCLSVCTSLCLSVCTFVCLYVCLSVRLSVCLGAQECPICSQSGISCVCVLVSHGVG